MSGGLLSLDGGLRRLERAHQSAPSDGELLLRYVRALLRARRPEIAAQACVQAGRAAEGARILFAEGQRVEGCKLIQIRWEARIKLEHSWGDDRLGWRGEPLSKRKLEELVQDDLAAFDPLHLAQNFPKKADGRYRLNTTRILRRYPANELASRHRRLHLVAWTPGTQSLYDRPADRGKHLITISLKTRASNKTQSQLPSASWRSPRAASSA